MREESQDLQLLAGPCLYFLVSLCVVERRRANRQVTLRIPFLRSCKFPVEMFHM